MVTQNLQDEENVRVASDAFSEIDDPDTFWSRAWRELRRRKLALIAVVILAILYTVGILAPIVAPHDYSETNLLKTQAPPDSENWLGTDRLDATYFLA